MPNHTQHEATREELLAENKMLRGLIKDVEGALNDTGINIGDEGVNGPGDGVALLASRVKSETLMREASVKQDRMVANTLFRTARRLQAIRAAGIALYNMRYKITDPKEERLLWDAFRDAIGKRTADDERFGVDFLAGIKTHESVAMSLRGELSALRQRLEEAYNRMGEDRERYEQIIRNRNSLIREKDSEIENLRDCVALADGLAQDASRNAKSIEDFIELLRLVVNIGPTSDAIDVIFHNGLKR